MDADAVLGGLDADQRHAATSVAMPLAVIAPAGSGKTRVLSTRIAYRVATGDAEPSHILCVTFTRRAADELRGRLRTLGLTERIETGTFHAIAWRQLRDRWAAQGRSIPRLIEHVPSFLREEVVPDTGRRPVTDLANEIGWARARLIRPDDYEAAARAAGRRTGKAPSWIAEQFQAYEAAKTRHHSVDFDDILAACATAMEGDTQFAAAQRWRFRHLFVDEAQDINPLQFRLLEAWRGNRWDVFLVGDTHQSIYGWNGADPALLETLGDRWPALETIHIDRTHRSTPQVTAAGAAVIKAAGLPDRHPDAMGAPGALPRIHRHEGGMAELASVSNLIRRRRGPGTPWSSFAVLARTHDQVAEIDRTLTAFGIPVRLADEEQPDDAVRVLTIHAAKGLEWPIVHIVGCEDGLIPHVSARRRDARAEEARLLYVAITRAELEVHLHWAELREIRGVVRERQRSPFLAGFEESVAASEIAAPDGAQPHLDALRATIGIGDAPDPLLTALQAWRSNRARAARTDPEVLLSDDSLKRIAAQRPSTVTELASASGLGPARTHRYADELVEIIDRHR